MKKLLFISILSSILLSGCAGIVHDLLFTNWNIPHDNDDDYYYYRPYSSHSDHSYFYEERKREEREREDRERENRERNERERKERQDGWQDSEQCGGGHSCKQFSPRL